MGPDCTAFCNLGFAESSSTVSATGVDCVLGANRRNNTSTEVMVCGAQRWKVAENCSRTDASSIGSAGNAYCEKEVECSPGESQCDAANYVAKTCNDKGLWQTDWKCS